MVSKRLLNKLPFYPLTTRKERVTFIKAEKHRFNKETVLSLSLSAKFPITYFDFEQWKNKRTGTHFVKAQLFLTKEDWVMKLIDEDGFKWSKSALSNSSFPWKLVFASEADEQIVTETLTKWGSRDIHDHQERLQKMRRARKHMPAVNKIKADMKLFGPVPKGYARFENEKVLFKDNYLFFNRGSKTAFCTYCEETFELPKEAKNNTEGKCPCCGNKFLWKSEGVGRGKLEAVRWSVLIQKKDGAFLFRYFRHNRTFWDSRNPKTYPMSEVFRWVIRENGWEAYEAGDYKNLGLVAWDYPKQHTMSCWVDPSIWWQPYTEMVYNSPKNLKKLIEGTWLKYSAADMLINKGEYQKGEALLIYMGKTYKNRPWIEKLLKCGYRRLAEEYAEGSYRVDGGETLKGILGISKESMRLFKGREAEVTREEVAMLQTFERTQHRSPNEREYALLSKVKPYVAEDYIRYSVRYGKFAKTLRYFVDNKIQTPDYADYVEWLRALKIPETEFTLYPKNFKEAHDLRMKEYRDKQDKIRQEAQRKFNEKLARMEKQMERELKEKHSSLSKGIKGLLIRLPKELSELDAEGAALHHCVATYKNRVMEGETTIYLIRKVKAPDKPFFTLEWKDGKVKQVRGKNNCDPTPEVKALVNIFEKTMSNKKEAALA